MDWKAYLRDFWVPLLKRKFNMIAIAIFVGTYFRLLPNWGSLFGIFAFLLAYTTIYYYNDLLDYERDMKHRFMPRDKLLYHGKASFRDYIILLGWIPVVGVSLAFLYSHLLGIFTAFAILANHIRTHVSQRLPRELLLGVVEFLNFEAFWIALYGAVIPGLAVPVFVAYSAAYALNHAVYKMRKQSLHRVLRQPWVYAMFLAFLVAAAFSIPLAASSAFHLVALITASIIYFGLVGVEALRYAENPEEGMPRIVKAHEVGVLLSGLVLVLVGAVIVYAHLPNIPAPIPAPRSMFYLLQSIDHYQQQVLSLAGQL